MDETKPGYDENVKRGNWSGKLDFLLSAIGYAVGLGNVWRFPYKCFKNGGGAFLIPYALMLAVAGLPLFFLELAFGQFCSQGPFTCWNVAPFFKGVGFGMVLISALVCVYYNVIIAWVFYYLAVSFQAERPWQTCYHDWNTPLCRQRWTDMYSIDENLTFAGPIYMCSQYASYVDSSDVCKWCSTLAQNISNNSENFDNTDYAAFKNGTENCAKPFGFENKSAAIESLIFKQNYQNLFFKAWNDSAPFDRKMLPNLTSPAFEYWDREVLGRSEGIGTIGQLQWKLALCLLAAWLLVFLCLIKGVKSSGKVVYFTATFPYLVLVILFIRGLMLDGMEEGIIWYLTPNWEKLVTPSVWGEAATQIFYSLGPGFGGLITMSSYNKFNNNCYRDALIVSILNCSTSVFAGFVIFSVIGFMSKSQGVNIEDVVDTGPGLAFIAYPEGIAQMPFFPPIWSILFFFMLITLGLDSQFVMMETLISAFVDQFPDYLRPRKIKLTALFCLIFFLIGLTNVTQGGIYVFTLFDWYSASFGILIVALMELIVIVWIYGYENFADDIQMMLGFEPNIYWRACWKLITPFTIVAILIFSAIKYTPVSYGTYVYPGWADALGWLMVAAAVGCIPGYMFYYFCSWIGASKLLEPTEEWGPAVEKNRTGRYKAYRDKFVHPIYTLNGRYNYAFDDDNTVLYSTNM